MAVPIANLWALGQIVSESARAGGDENPGVAWRRGWAEGAAALAILGAYATLASVLGYGLGLVLDFVPLFAALKPFLWVGLGFVATLGTVTAWAALAEGRPLFLAADPIEGWGRIRRAPAVLLWAALAPYAVALLGIWILPQAVFLGLWLAVEIARGGLRGEP